MDTPETYYITTPIYYVNDKPHLGHAYTTIMCDILRRYYRLLGADTYFLTGTDEHGENIFRTAKEKGRDVREMVDENSDHFRNLWPKLNISNDDFIRTTQQRHVEVVQDVLQRTYDAGDIYQAEYGGNYCVKCERYFTDKDVEDNPGFCPIHETELEYLEESNYFFRLSKYQDWLREKIENDPQFLGPQQYRSEVLALLREPLGDLCISRPIERMHWGIPLPFDKEYVTYVWYDALINYLSGIGYPKSDIWEKYWAESTHMIAKDILRQHAVYWPCMLKAAEIEPFKRLRVHGWWTVEGKKMSKTRGNVVDPLAEAEKYGLDVFRYFLAREMSFGSDGDYNAKGLVGRNNAELANDLGNLVSRLTSMIKKYCDGKMPAVANPTEVDTALMEELEELREILPEYLERPAIHAYLERIMQTIAETNRYVTDQAPWTRFKEGNTDRVATILAVASRMVAVTGQLLYPVMPEKMAELLACYKLEIPEELNLDPLVEGIEISPAKALFPQLEAPEVEEVPEAEAAPVKDEVTLPQVKDQITIDDFAKIDLRVAKVLSAEPIPKTDKLLKLQIDLGFEKRQLVAGLAKHYQPDDLVGRQIIVVANLAPARLRGVESQGMLLAAASGKDLIILGPQGEAILGSQIS
ncbi:MAG: methionine--tRNA ligase [Candidatus Sumerlaeota bacterium]